MHHVNVPEVVAYGLMFDPKQAEALRTMDWQKLLATIPQLFDLLEQREIEYALVGGVAVLVYVTGRNTQDIDLILSDDGLRQLPEVRIVERQGEFVRGQLGDLQVDVLLTENRLFDKVLHRFALRQRLADRDIPCASVDGLLLLKLFALPSLYRQGDFTRVALYEHDIAMLLRTGQSNVSQLFDELADHVSQSDLQELRSIVAEIEQRAARAAQRFGDAATAPPPAEER